MSFSVSPEEFEKALNNLSDEQINEINQKFVNESKQYDEHHALNILREQDRFYHALNNWYLSAFDNKRTHFAVEVDDLDPSIYDCLFDAYRFIADYACERLQTTYDEIRYAKLLTGGIIYIVLKGD